MTQTEKIIQKCTDCKECVKACGFLKQYCDSPKELAKRFVKNHLENIEILYSCTLCGLCQRICRYSLYPGGMCHEARIKIFEPVQGSNLPHDFIYNHIIPKMRKIRYHQYFSTSSIFTLSNIPEERKKPLPRTVFFPGCSFSAYAPGLARKTYLYLREKIPGTGVILNCCGKPTMDLGDKVKFQKIFNNTMGKLSELGVEEVICSCINCHKVFRENSDIKLRTIYEVMAEKGLPEPGSGSRGQVVTVHDSCPARYQPKIRRAVRNIISQLGYDIHELRFKNELTQCCGAGGCAHAGNAALADRHTLNRASRAQGPIITYCAHCRERFASKIPALHIMDLVFGFSYKKPLARAHDSWQNWLGRWYLKKNLKKI